jgi:hypothetical protein
MVGATTFSTLVVAISTSSDWVITIPGGYLQVSTIAAFDTIGEVVLIR